MREIPEIEKSLENAVTYLRGVGVENPDEILLSSLRELAAERARDDIRGRFLSYDLHSLLLAITRFISNKSQISQGPIPSSSGGPANSMERSSAQPCSTHITPSVNNLPTEEELILARTAPPVETQEVEKSQEVEFLNVPPGEREIELRLPDGRTITLERDGVLEVIKGSKGWRLRNKATKQLVSLVKILSGEHKYPGVTVR